MLAIHTSFTRASGRSPTVAATASPAPDGVSGGPRPPVLGELPAGQTRGLRRDLGFSVNPLRMIFAVLPIRVRVTVESTVTNYARPVTRSFLASGGATDCCSNSVTCTQTVTVVTGDITLPVILDCPSNKIVGVGPGWKFDRPTAFDDCSGTNVSLAALMDFGHHQRVLTNSTRAPDKSATFAAIA